MLGFQVLLHLRWEWETVLPKVTPLPQTLHFAMGIYLLIVYIRRLRDLVS